MDKVFYSGRVNNILRIPDGLRELLMDISREVLREQPTNMYDFIADYLSALLITRENMAMASKLVDSICEDQPNIINELKCLGLELDKAEKIYKFMLEFFSKYKKKTLAEENILKIIIRKTNLPEDKVEGLCRVVRRAYFMFTCMNSLNGPKEKYVCKDGEAASRAVRHTINIAKSIVPLEEQHRAAIVIQTAYRKYTKRQRDKEMQKLGDMIPAANEQSLFERNKMSSHNMVKLKDSSMWTWPEESYRAHMYD